MGVVERKRVGMWKRLGYMLIAMVCAIVMYLSTGDLGNGSAFSLGTDFEGSYVLEDIEIEYMLDDRVYEAIVPESSPYAVVRGDKKLINLLKLTGKPKFSVDLRGKGVGKYQERVIVSGIHKDLDVEVYPGLLDVRVQELQTMRLVPVVELAGVEELSDRGLVVSVPELVDVEEVRVFDKSVVLSEVGQIRGDLDVTDLGVGVHEVEVELRVFDKSGNVMRANLLDSRVVVRVEVKEQAVVVEENIVEQIVRVEEVVVPVEDSESDAEKGGSNTKSDADKGEDSVKDGDKNSDSETERETDRDTDNGNVNESEKSPVKTPEKKPEVSVPVKEEKPVVTKPVEKPKLGKLEFVNVGKGMEIESDSLDKKFSSNIRVDVRGFKVGLYELKVRDLGVEYVIRFEIRLIGEEDGIEVSPEESESGE